MSATGAENVTIRDAVPDDAAACQVLKESISRLCVADRGNDPAILNAWLANKTPEIVAAWAVQKGSSLLLAIEGDAVLGVGSVTDAGEITLNYVAPVARFRGVSRALLKALEARAVERGNSRCTLSRLVIATTVRRPASSARPRKSPTAWCSSPAPWPAGSPAPTW